MKIFSSQLIRRVARADQAPRAAAARVLARAKNGTRSALRKAALRSADFFRVARAATQRAVAPARAFATREYSPHSKTRRVAAPRFFVPALLGLIAATALLTANVSRAQAQTTSATKKQTAAAKAIARADADFDNSDPGRSETSWGRLVADAMKSASGADVALLSAASLAPGTLSKGAVRASDIDALLAYPDDAVVTRTVSGAQLRAALELAVKDFPNDSPRFLQVAGISATFDGDATRARLLDLKINGRALQDSDVFNTAMPISLSQGAGGFFTVWGKTDGDAKTVGALNDIIANYAARRGHLAPDKTARIVAR